MRVFASPSRSAYASWAERSDWSVRRPALLAPASRLTTLAGLFCILTITTQTVAAMPSQDQPAESKPAVSEVAEATAQEQSDLDAELKALIAELDPPPLEEILSWFGPIPTVEQALTAKQSPPANVDPKVVEDLEALEATMKAAEREQRYADALVLSRELHRQAVLAYGENHALSGLTNNTVLALAQICQLPRKELAQLASLAQLDRQARHEYEMGRYARGLPPLLQAYNTRVRVLGHDHPHALESLHNIALFLGFAGNLQHSLAFHRASVAEHVERYGPEHAHTLHVLAVMAGTLDGRGHTVEAASLASYALIGLRQQLGAESRGAQAALNHLGNALENAADLTNAIACRREQLRLARESGDDRSLPLALLNLGGVLSAVGHYSDAVACLDEALALDRARVGDHHPDVAYTLDTLATTLWTQGHFERAELLQREAVTLARRTLGITHPDTQVFSSNLAALLYRRGQLAEAEALVREVLANEQMRYGLDSHQRAGTLHVLAGILLEADQLEASEAAAREGLRIVTLTCPVTHPYQSTLRVRLAQILMQRGRYDCDEVEALLHEAFRVDKELSRPGLIHTAAWYGDFLREQKRLPEAVSVYGAAVASLDQLQHASSGDDLEKAAFVSFVAQREPVGGLILSLAELRSADESTAESRDTSLMTAFQAYEQARARSLLSLLRKGRLRAGSTEDATWKGTAGGTIDALADRESILAYEVTREGTVLFAIKSTGVCEFCTLPGMNTASLAELRMRRTTAAGSHERPRISPSVEHHGLLSETAWQTVSGASRVFVVPDGPLHRLPFEMLAWNEQTGELWIDAGPPIVYGPSGTVIMTKRKWAQARKTTRDGNEQSTALVAIGDPIFARLALGTTQTPESPAPDHGVLLASVISDSNAYRSGLRAGDVLLKYDGVKLGGPADLGPAIQAAHTRGDKMTKAQSGDATMTRGEDRSVPTSGPTGRVPTMVWREGKTLEFMLAPGQMGVRASQCSMPTALHDWRGLQLSDDERFVKHASATTRDGFGETLKPLPGTRVEVNALADVMKRAGVKPNSIKVLTGEDATLTKLLEVTESPRFLHLATHGKVEGRYRVYESAVALTVPEEPTPEDFGFLRLQDLLEKWGGRLEGTELVVLSGCDTATGRLEAADGFVGLTWGFLFAGADSVIASLWKVDDAATALLMHRLYENLLGTYDQPRWTFDAGTPMPKAEALHEAKRWLRHQTPEQNRQMLTKLGMDVEQLQEHYRTERGRLPSEDPQTLPDPFDYSHPRYWAAFVLIGSPD